MSFQIATEIRDWKDAGYRVVTVVVGDADLNHGIYNWPTSPGDLIVIESSDRLINFENIIVQKIFVGTFLSTK